MKIIFCNKENKPENTIWIGKGSKFYNQNPWFQNKKMIGVTYRQYFSLVEAVHPNILDELKSKDLACDCNDNKLCHGNILIDFLKEDEQPVTSQ